MTTFEAFHQSPPRRRRSVDIGRRRNHRDKAEVGDHLKPSERLTMIALQRPVVI